jgi:hypothetical protein
MNWYRTHHGMWSDPKLALVARRAGSSLPMAIAVWSALLDCASQARQRGNIDGFDAESVAFAFGCETAEIEAILSSMAAKGMVEDGRIARWEDRQYDKPSDAPAAVAERVARHRAAKKADAETPCNAPVTPCNAIEERRGEESRAEESLLQPQSLTGGVGGAAEPLAVATSERRPTRAPSGTRLPADWEPDDAATAWAQANHPEIDLADATARFTDYWRSQPAQRAVKTDWPATWRNWIRTSAERGQSLRRHSSPPAGRIIPSGLRSRPSRAEEIENINREAAAAAVRHGIVRPAAPTAGERP